MKTYQIIERTIHQLPRQYLLFYLWLSSKYPKGVEVSKIHPPMSLKKRTVVTYLCELESYGLIQWEGKRSGYSRVIPKH